MFFAFASATWFHVLVVRTCRFHHAIDVSSVDTANDAGDSVGNSDRPCVIISGGAGFIGSNLVHRIIRTTSWRVVVIDALTYAGNLDNFADLAERDRFVFVHADLCDRELIDRVFCEHAPTGVFHLAAESHVDRSIDGPRAFVRTNVLGTFELLDAARLYWEKLPHSLAHTFRFLHVSTDEVYGSLGAQGLFSEQSAYAPNSPYAASKAGADHLVRSYFHTYGMPVITTNCSNNYGPFQFPEKLIPLVILNALEGKSLPVYGDGANVRDWLHVQDHCDALLTVAAKGRIGQTYNIGTNNERTTLQIVHALCDLLDEMAPVKAERGTSYRELIQFVKDRPGHDRRYAIDATKIMKELGWKPSVTFDEGLRRTVSWYLSHRGWCDRITRGVYQRERLGLLEGET